MISPKGGSPIASNNPNPKLVLASESPRRLALLAQIGVTPDAVIPAHIDEVSLKNELPRLHAQRLAIAKARNIAQQVDAATLVLAADTVVACGRRILPKAMNDDDVRSCLKMLSGRSHQVFTAVTIAKNDGCVRHRTVMTRVSFVRLLPDAIERYVGNQEGLGKAGGYAIQGRAEAYVRQISGSYSNVVGLPLMETVNLLAGCGYRVSC